MRIGIDARLYNETGIGRYIRNLLFELGDLDDRNEYFIYLGKRVKNFRPPNTHWNIRRVDFRWHSFKEQLLYPPILLKDHLDVMHFPYFSVPVFYPGRYILTIHDLIVDHFDTGRASTLPGFFYKMKRLSYKLVMKKSLAFADKILAISKSTKFELLKHYELDKKKIIVTYDALDRDFIRKASSKNIKRIYDFKYLLYVGNAYPHKNLENLLKALKTVFRKKEIKMVMAGNDAYFYPRLRNFVDNIRLKDRVIFFGQADDEDLVSLYRYAEALVFPSFMEGFGLPTLESLYCWCLPIISKIDAFMEIWKDKLPMFNPENPEDISTAINKVLKMKSDEKQLIISQARKIISEYSWKKTAKATLEAYTRFKITRTT